MQFDSEVFGSLVESSMSGIRNDPVTVSTDQFTVGSLISHFRLCYSAFSVRLLPRCQTGHQDRFSTTGRSNTSTIRRSIEQCEYLSLIT